MGGILRRFLVWPASMICELERKTKKEDEGSFFPSFPVLTDSDLLLLQGLHLSSTLLSSTLFTPYPQEE